MAVALVIEDNSDNMALICDVLEVEGYSTIRANCGMQGCEYAQKFMPDFIVLDIQLPDISGFEVLERLRNRVETKYTPVVAMTSYAMAGDKEKLLAAGCDGYLEKPIDPILVVKQIKNVVNKH